MKRFVERFPVLSYVLCCLVPVHGIMWPALVLGVAPETLRPLKLPFAVIPTVSAFLIVFLLEREKGVSALVRSTFHAKTKIWIYPATLLIFPCLAAIAMTIRYYHDGFYSGQADWKPIWMIIVASPFLFLIPGVFEEYGWRGFMQKRLKSRTGVFVASIVVGLTWGMWHLMDFLMGNWLFEPFTVAVFFLYIVGVSLVSGFFYELSGGSVIVAMIVHFSANFVNSFFPIWRLETGVLSPLLYIGLIWLFCVIVFLAGFALSKTSGSGS